MLKKARNNSVLKTLRTTIFKDLETMNRFHCVRIKILVL